MAFRNRGAAGRPRGRLLRWLRILAIPTAIVVVAGLIIFGTVSMRVAARFEAREGESPTRMYGRALPLREGTLLPVEVLATRLERLGYRRTRATPTVPGEYSLGRRKVTVWLRSFEGPGGNVTGKLVTIRHGEDRIESVRDEAGGRSVSDAVLEPEVLATLHGERAEERTILPLSAFPQQLVDAVLLVEDRHFYSHLGLDPFGIARAAVTNIRSGEIRQGGSTLTQQLAKNLFFDHERTWSRKVGEAAVAVVLETRYSKDRILQAYLNEVYLGQKGSVSIRGFAEAANFYFGKDVSALDLGDIALLAGLIRSPGHYNPLAHPKEARERRNQVLDLMQEEGRITAEQKTATEAAPLDLHTTGRKGAPSRGVAYLGDYVKQMIGDGAGDLSHAGIRIWTTVDPIYQREAEMALRDGLATLERNYRHLRPKDSSAQLQGAMVVLDQHDGSVLAMVGGRDYATSQFNRIMQAKRQPGSLFKPFVFLAGWSEGSLTPATPLMDEPLEMTVAGQTWAPANYDRTFRGPVTAQMALEESLNVPTVRASQEVGLREIAKAAKSAGIESELKLYPSMVLGAQEVTPMEIASAYATIANGGVRVKPVLVEGIQDPDGSWNHLRKREEERALSAQASYQVTVALQGAMDRGTARSSRDMGFGGTAAGKTGTTDDYRDAWFSGFTPDLLALVWVGFDDGRSVDLPGATAALPIWVDFIRRSGAETSTSFDEPPGIVWQEIDPTSGGIARWSCPLSWWMAFPEGTEPVDQCESHGWFPEPAQQPRLTDGVILTKAGTLAAITRISMLHTRC